jgi:hypothetical protein
MTQLVTRAYNRFETSFPKGIITKISKEPRLRDERGYYIAINRDCPDQAVYFPRFVDFGTRSSDAGDEYWFSLEYLCYPTLSDLVLGKIEHLIWWDNVFRDLSSVMNEWDTVKDPQSGKKDYAREMYITKTQSEYNKFKYGWSDQIGNLFDETAISINNRPYSNFHIIWPEIRDYIEQHMLDYDSVLIHGDCCFSNIFYSDGMVRFIDPRGSFGKLGIYGDRRYDIAKLYHSVDGMYDFIINDRFTVTTHGADLELKFHRWQEAERALGEFEKHFFPKYNQKEIKILQGCIYIGMCARHYDSLARQTVMYATGVRLLNEALEL